MAMRGSQKLFLAACAALIGLPGVLAEPWRDPSTGQLSCRDSKGIPQCSTQYRVKSSCGGENAQACVRAWCNELKQLVTDESAHISLEQCAAENAKSSARRALNDSAVLNSANLTIGFRVKGDVIKTDAKVHSGLSKITATLNSDLDYKDDNQDLALRKAETAFSRANLDMNQEYCLGHGKKYKHVSSYASCLVADSGKNAVIETFSSGTIKVTNSKNQNFAKNEYIKIVDNSNSGNWSIWIITAAATTATGTFTAVRKGPNSGSHTEGAANHIVHHLGAYAPTATLSADVTNSASALSVVTQTDEGEFFAVNDRIQLGAEILTVTAINADKKTLTVTRADAGTNRDAHSTGDAINNLSSCRKAACATVACTSSPTLTSGSAGSMCVTADKFGIHGSANGRSCAYYNCQQSDGQFANDAQCCAREKATCNSGFHTSSSNDDAKSEARTACASGKHVAFAHCNSDDCGSGDAGTCCVDHNSTGLEFGDTTEVQLKANFSSGNITCGNALKYPEFYQHLSDAVAKSLGKHPWEVVLVKAPACPRVRALRTLADAAFELEALFSIKGALPKVDASTGRHLDMETRAQAAYVAFLSRLLG